MGGNTLTYKIVSFNVGKPSTYQFGTKEIETGFVKKPIEHAVRLTKTGFTEDGQADLKNHGGEEKALLFYPVEHYPFWEKHYDRSFSYPAFGENITIKGLTEEAVYIGDQFQLGDAIIEMSQPRQPCYKIAAYHQIKDIPKIVTETGYGGYYFRVLKEGDVSKDSIVEKVYQDPAEISSSAIFKALFHNSVGERDMHLFSEHPKLASNVRASLKKKLERK